VGIFVETIQTFTPTNKKTRSSSLERGTRLHRWYRKLSSPALKKNNFLPGSPASYCCWGVVVVVDVVSFFTTGGGALVVVVVSVTFG
jgi:hypothetical protein